MKNESLRKSFKEYERIAALAAEAVMSVEGVAALSPTGMDIINDSFGINAPEGIKLSEKNGELTIDIYVTVHFGMQIPEISWDIQEKVKNALEGESDYTTGSVNIHIEGIRFPEVKGKQ